MRHHIGGQIQATVAAGHEVHLISSPISDFSGQNDDRLEFENTNFHPIPIARNLSPLSDLRSLLALYRCFREIRCDIVHSVTSKAGLLCALAGFAARVPLRLHTFAGQPWSGRTGPIRWISKACDWLIVRLNTCCYTDSESQRAFLIKEGVARDRHIRVLGAGSIAGVDLTRFSVARFDRRQAKAGLAIPAQAVVIVFVGRISREKGVGELVAAFEQLDQTRQGQLHLLMVGPFETGRNALPPEARRILDQHAAIKVIGYTDKPEDYLAVADILCLPSYREGFGSVIIEAAAMGVPAVATRVTGLVDAVVEGETGLMVPPYDVAALAGALARLRDDIGLRQRLGAAARDRACRLFDAAVVNQLVIDDYETLAEKRR
jgi:glycosyltransferase involved in cell wall biosynthesis